MDTIILILLLAIFATEIIAATRMEGYRRNVIEEQKIVMEILYGKRIEKENDDDYK